VIAIIVTNPDSVRKVNDLLHEKAEYIIGRMGIPDKEKGIPIISVAIDAPQSIISGLSGQIGRLSGVSTKTAYSNIVTHE
jgi:putative iron-only hydrogenase system regulator